jgi:hypothetical protein
MPRDGRWWAYEVEEAGEAEAKLLTANADESLGLGQRARSDQEHRRIGNRGIL